jgi:hypothetical protein
MGVLSSPGGAANRWGAGKEAEQLEEAAGGHGGRPRRGTTISLLYRRSTLQAVHRGGEVFAAPVTEGAGVRAGAPASNCRQRASLSWRARLATRP